MGVMRFVEPDVSRLTPEIQQRTLIVGYEGMPWRSHLRVSDHGFSIHKVINESGYVYTPWAVEGFGQPLLCTTSLAERERPYNLPLELARGTLNRLRNQKAAWQGAGLQIDDGVEAAIHAASAAFISAATRQHDSPACAAHADESIQASLIAMRELVACFVRQILSPQSSGDHPETLVAATLGRSPDGSDSPPIVDLSSYAVPIVWGEVEAEEGVYDWSVVDQQIAWCQSRGSRIIGGPLLSFDQHSLPGWIYLYEDQPEQLEAAVVNWIQVAASHLAGKVNLWHLAAKLNTGEVLSLNEEQRLRLTIAVVNTIGEITPKTPAIISFDQPWAEYMSRNDSDVAPLHYADAIARSDLKVSGFGLELNIGYTQGSLPRDPLAVSQLVDSWSQLGLPLIVFLTLPSSEGADPLARRSSGIIAGPASDVITPQSHADAVARIVEVLICKHSVQGVVWNQWSDAVPHAFAHGGLIGQDNQRKPVCNVLEKMANVARSIRQPANGNRPTSPQE